MSTTMTEYVHIVPVGLSLLTNAGWKEDDPLLPKRKLLELLGENPRYDRYGIPEADLRRLEHEVLVKISWRRGGEIGNGRLTKYGKDLLYRKRARVYVRVVDNVAQTESNRS